MVAGRAVCGNKLTGNSHDSLLCCLNSSVSWTSTYESNNRWTMEIYVVTHSYRPRIWLYIVKKLSSYTTIMSQIYENAIRTHQKPILVQQVPLMATFIYISSYLINEKWYIAAFALLKWWQLALWNFHGSVNGTWRVCKSWLPLLSFKQQAFKFWLIWYSLMVLYLLVLFKQNFQRW